MTTSSEKLTPEADKLDELAQRGGPCDPAGRSPGGVSPMEISMVSIDTCNIYVITCRPVRFYLFDIYICVCVCLCVCVRV